MGPALSGPRRAAAGLAGAALLIAAITIASRLTGFGRSLVLAATVGPNALGSAYTSANIAPTVLFEVVAGGALAGAVVPLLAGPIARADREEANRTVSALLGWALVVLVPLGAALALLASPVASTLLGPSDPATHEVTVGFLRVFAVQVPLYGVAVVLFGLLQAHRRFAWPALAPLLNNVLVIGVLAWYGAMTPGSTGDPAAVPRAALAWLAWGTTAGVGAMALAVVVPALRTGLHVRPTLRFAAGVAPRARALLLAGIGAVLAQQIATLVMVRLSNGYGGDGAVLVLLFVQQVYLLPYAVLAYPVVTAAFPPLADAVARGDTGGFARLAAGTTRAVLAVAAGGAAALVAGAGAVEAGYARIAAGQVTGTADALTWMAPGLVGFVVGFHASRALYALHRGRAAGLTVGVGWVLAAVLALAVAPVVVPDGPDQVATLGLLGAATSVGMTVGGGAALAALARAAGRAALTGLVRTGLVTLGGATLGALVGRLAADRVLTWLGDGVVEAALAVVVGAGIAVGVLAGALAAADRTVLRGLRHRPDTPGGGVDDEHGR